MRGAVTVRHAVVDQLVRLAGGLVALAGGLLVAVQALVLVPLRVDTPLGVLRLPVAVVLAVVGNLVLIWFARVTTGTRWGALLPASGWFVVALAAMGVTSEGDRLLVPDDWVAMLTLFGGTATVVVGVAVTIAGRPGPRLTDHPGPLAVRRGPR